MRPTIITALTRGVKLQLPFFQLLRSSPMFTFHWFCSLATLTFDLSQVTALNSVTVLQYHLTLKTVSTRRQLVSHVLSTIASPSSHAFYHRHYRQSLTPRRGHSPPSFWA